MTPLLKAALRVAGPWVLVGALGFGWIQTYKHQQREIGRQEERVAVLETQYRSLERTKARVDTLYKTKTVKLSADTVRWRRLVDSLSSLVPDTVKVPVEVIRTVVLTADSALASCAAVILSCESRVAVRDSQLTVLRQQLSTSTKPSSSASWSTRLLWAAGGLAAGILMSRQ